MPEPADGGGGEVRPDAVAGSPGDLPEPDPRLLAALRRWRRETSAAAGVPPYRVLSNAVLEEIARRRPHRLEALLQIKGIGQAKLQQYGEALLRLSVAKAIPPGEEDSADTLPANAIEPPEQAVPEPNAAPPPAQGRSVAPSVPLEHPPGQSPQGGDSVLAAPGAAAASEDPAVQPSYYWTWRLLSAGFSAAQCEAIRGLSRETILDHALRALEEGRPVQAEWCLPAELLAALRQNVNPEDPPEIRAVLARLPPGTRYEEVLLYLECRGQSCGQ